MTAMKVSVGSDHRGVNLKQKVCEHLRDMGHEIVDMGTNGTASCDYPDIAAGVAQSVCQGDSQRGILICGSGIGMAITANKFDGVRAATCNDEFTAELCRRHNDVNVLCLAGDMLGERSIDSLLRIWLDTEFDGGRHARRLEKISQLERDRNSCNRGSREGE